MPTPNEVYKKLSSLPEEIQELLNDIKTNRQIGEKYRLDNDRMSKMVHTMSDVILKYISLENFPGALKENVGLSDDIARQMALDIALKRFLVLRKHLGDVPSLIRRLGGQMPEVLPEPPKPKPKPPTRPPQPTPSPREALLAKLKARRPYPYREPISEEERKPSKPPVPPSNIVDLSKRD